MRFHACSHARQSFARRRLHSTVTTGCVDGWLVGWRWRWCLASCNAELGAIGWLVSWSGSRSVVEYTALGIVWCVEICCKIISLSCSCRDTIVYCVNDRRACACVRNRILLFCILFSFFFLLSSELSTSILCVSSTVSSFSFSFLLFLLLHSLFTSLTSRWLVGCLMVVAYCRWFYCLLSTRIVPFRWLNFDFPFASAIVLRHIFD